MNDVESRYCDGCVRFLPVDRFRPRSKDGRRMRRCNDCHAAAERERRTVRRSKAERSRLRRRFTALVDERNRHRIELLAAVMLDDFGGLSGFVAAWRDYLADARRRGGLAMFRGLQVTLRLLEHSDMQRPLPGEMSDADLEASVADFLQRHPELAAIPTSKCEG